MSTKVWPGNEAWGQPPKTFESTIEALNAGLARLQLDFVDLSLIHAPFPKNQRLDQWRALLELRRLGKARAIGVSNFNVAHLEEIKAAGMPLPDANQIERHPWSQKSELVTYLSHNGITPIAYSSLAPLANWRVVEGHNSGKTEKMKADGVREDSPFKILAKKYRVTEAQILLRWALQKGYPILPKSVNKERMRQNIDLFAFEIDDEDMAAIAGMDRGDGIVWSGEDPCNVP